MSNLKVSFIIPAYNEELRIQKTIKTIIAHVPDEFHFEVIVVDHGSEDRTCELVRETTATLLSHVDGSISSLRNFGVMNASGHVLVFIDADVLLTSNWTKRFRKVAPLLVEGRPTLTGSWVKVPNNARWIENNWFKPLEKGANTHINSGHLIITKNNFERIGGFDERLETGEDYEISMRAKSHGIDIVDDVLLEATHEGYPQNVKEFFLREFWHGKGDSHSLSLIFKSKVALTSFTFFFLHLLLLFTVFMGIGMLPAIACLVGILLLVFVVTIVKYRHQMSRNILANVFLYYVYFWARTFSLATFFSWKPGAKRER
jgi:glycosyltransferase involved in cell wall biosynthesis